MSKKTGLERAIELFSKMELDNCIEVYHSVGQWLHTRIEEHQKRLGETLNKYQTEKIKIKQQNPT